MQVSALDNKTPQVQKPIGPQKQLDKNAFLQLLVAQLKNQNPLQPKDTDTFITQMVQFTTLEQLTNISSIMERLAGLIELSQGVSLIGHRIKLLNEKGEQVSGMVEKVCLQKDDVYLQVNNETYKLSQLVEVLG